MRCLTCSSRNVNGRTPSELDPASGAAQSGMPGVIVCRQCGAVHRLPAVQDPGSRVLAQLASVGLGAGAPPVLSPNQGSH